MNLAVVFPGQGCQYTGMGSRFYQQFSFARQLFEEAGDSLGFDLKSLCFEGERTELAMTSNAQPAILTVSVIAFRVWQEEFGIEPAYMAGHSLGEYTALVCSGAIEFSDAVKLVRHRGNFMQRAVPLGEGKMAAVKGVTLEVLESLCADLTQGSRSIHVACLNSTNQNVISGHTEVVEVAIKRLNAMHARATPLNVSAPFHCPLMHGAASEMDSELKKYSFGPMNSRVISNVTALPYEGIDNTVKEMLLKQMTMPVRWADTMRYLKKQKVTDVIEIGPKRLLGEFISDTIPDVAAHSFSGPDSLSEFGTLLSSTRDKQQRVVEQCLTAAVTARNRNWSLDDYEMRVNASCRALETLHKQTKDHTYAMNMTVTNEALTLLQAVLEAKQATQAEIQRFLGKIKQLF